MRNHRMYFTALVLSAVACTFLSAHEPQTGADMLKQIQGTWKFNARDMDGKAATKEELAKMNITFTGDKWEVREGGKLIQAGTHKFDPSKKPARIEAIISEGEGKGTTMLGICELMGDTFKVCFNTAGKEHPTSFTAKAGQLFATIQRDKK
jgi:uncharacterized protein (TIGR03067 family)